MTRSVSHPVIPAQAGIQNSAPFLDSRLRGNDGYFDRLDLKKARGGTKAWPDTKLREVGRQYSRGQRTVNYRRYAPQELLSSVIFFVSRWLGGNLVCKPAHRVLAFQRD
jgi:hypothetical protein